MRALRWSIALLGALGIAAGAFVAWPVPRALLAPSDAQTLLLQDRQGRLLRATRAGDGSLARWVPLSSMDPDLPRAFVAVEDRRFFTHHGIDVHAVGRALRDNFRSRGVVSGASTLTMQLACLVHPIGHGPVDKVVQALWALRLEAHLSKNEILEQYLNRVPLGQGTVGVAAAMRLYFGAGADQVSLGQAALLAALAQAPSSRNPLVSQGRALTRRRIGLAALEREGWATGAEVERALEEPVLDQHRTRPFLAPHFTSRLLLDAEAAGRPLVGTWRTSLDLALQEELEAEVRHTVATLGDRGVEHAATVVLDNRSGEVLAWVGSPDFWADTAGQVDMVTSPRQPGSSLKPFLYALALDRGVTAATVLADIATTWQTAAGPYHPRNYDRRFHGPVRVREALASSFNIPAVRLAEKVGVGTLLNGLHDAGFASLGRSAEHYGLGLALGNGDVTLLELANGYRTLANGGRWSPTRTIALPTGDAPASGGRLASERASALVLDILADPDARIPGFGLETPFDWPFRVAAKTGTSRHFTDNWAVGVTQAFTVAVWVGNFSGRPMEGVSGITGAGPLLHRAVLAVAARYAPGSLPRPTDLGLEAHVICRTSGLRPGRYCPTVTEYFLRGSAPDHTCDWHEAGGVTLPVQYAEWAGTEGRTLGGRATVPLGAAAAALAPDSARVRRFVITSPEDGDFYRIPPGVEAQYATIGLRSAGARGTVEWFVDGRRVAGGRWPLVPGQHRIRARAGQASDEVMITVE